MLDPKFIRENADAVRDTLQRQRKDASVLDTFLKADAEWRKLKLEADKLRHERNSVSEQINQAKKSGQDASQLLAKAKEIPKRLAAMASKMDGLGIKTLLGKIPNVMHKDVPYGKDDSENKEVKRWGEPRKFDFKIKTHVELAESLGLADFDASAITSGNGFYYLKGALGLLNQSLIRFAIDRMQAKGYEYVEPPLMVRREILDAAMDTGAIEQSIYSLRDEDLCLIGTAEYAILGMLAGRTLKKLPLKYAGYSMCFRKEIGSHGINEKGLWRTHQFNKVEQFVFCHPGQSEQLYGELFNNSEEILQQLGLPYRVVEICTGDLAPWKFRSHDFEVWRPTTNSYGEVMSLSNCTTYQSTDLGVRYDVAGDRGFVHTLNNTALATSRIIVAILENYQQQDGSVLIPEALRGLMGREKL